MTILRIIFGILLLVLIALGGALAYLHFADLNKLRPHIEKAFSDATGRELRIAGDLQLDLLPTLTLLVEDLSLANAPWGSAPDMVKIGHFSAAIDLWSALSGPAVIEDIKLENASLLLEQGPDGEANWEFAAAAEEPAEPAPPRDGGAGSLPAMIRHAQLSNVSVVYRAAGQDEQRVMIDDLTLAPGQDDNLALQGKGTVLQQPLSLDGTVGPLDELEALGAVAFNLKGRLGPLKVRLGGQTTRLDPLTGSSVAAVLTADELADLMKLARLDLPLRGPIQVDADLAQLERGANLQLKARFADIDASADARLRQRTVDLDASVSALEKLGKALGIAGLPPGKLTLNGSVTQDGGAIALQELTAKVGEAVAVINGTVASGGGPSALDIEADGPRLTDLQPSLPPIPWKLKAQTEVDARLVVLKPFEARFGDSDLSGDLRIAEHGKGKAVDVTLRSRLLDLSPFMKDDDESAPADAASPPARAEAQTRKAQRAFVFKDEPLPFAALKHNTLDADLAIRQFRASNTTLSNVKLQGSLHDQVLKGDASLAGPLGGKATSRVELDAGGDVAKLSIKLKAKDMRLNLTSGKDATPTQIPAVGATVDIASRGNTPRALAASSNGRVLLTQGPGKLDNELLGRVSGDILSQLFSALNPFAKDEQYSNWDCSVIGVDIVDGDADLTVFLLQGEKIMALAAGGVDLNTEKIGIEFNTKPRKGVGISADMFVTPFVKLSGTLADPGIGLNEKGALLTTGAAVATGGISLLVTGVLDRATAEGDQCAKAMEKFNKHGAETGR